MMDDKKDYKEALKALAAQGTVATVLNRLTAIEVDTEDAQLKKMLNAIASGIRNIHAKPSEKLRLLSIPKEHTILAKTAEIIAITSTYCNGCISAAEPQWTILARRAGWTPPAPQ